MIAQAVAELNNKVTHCQSPVLERSAELGVGTGGHKNMMIELEKINKNFKFEVKKLDQQSPK